MRGKLYCHGVRSEDDGRMTAYMTSDDTIGGPRAEVTITAPFEAFDEDEVPRTWHQYRIKLERVDEN